MLNLKLFSLSILAMALTGCVSADLDRTSMAGKVAKTTETMVREAVDEQAPAKANSPVTEFKDKRFVDFKAVKLLAKNGGISLNVSDVPFAALVNEISEKANFSVSFADTVAPSRKVTLKLANVTPEDAIKEIAFVAGYVAVVDSSRKMVTISDLATYTFKLPPSVFQNLSANYTVGGNPISSAASSASAGGEGGGAAAGASGMQASFTVKGSSGVGGPQNVSGLLKQVAGPNAEVYLSPDSGIVTVRSNAQALRRTSDFLKSFVKDAMTQVDLETTILEVSLTDQFSLGIDWNKLVSAGNLGSGTLRTAVSAGVIAAPSTTFTYTGSSVSSIITALRKYADVSVVFQPRLTATNHTPATLFDGTQVPYLGNLTTTTTGTAGGAQTSGSISYAVDGIGLSIQPDVIDKDRVQVTIVPAISTVHGLESFSLGTSGTLTAPKQGSKQAIMKAIAENGKMLIISGIRYKSNSKLSTGGPIPVLTEGRDDAATVKEVVILMRATVLAAPEFDSLISESI